MFRLHPRYFYLIRKNRKLDRQREIERKNIFIITSCINTYDEKKYVNHNLAHSPEVRFDEVLTGLRSIGENYADRYIIFVENSRISAEKERRIRSMVDEYHNYSDADLIKIARRHYNKGVPQFAALIKFIEENEGKYRADVFHFLGARYTLTGSVATGVDRPGAYFLFYPAGGNISTRYFFLKKMELTYILSPFRKTLYCAIFGNSVEDYLHRFIRDIHFVDVLKVAGKVNGVEMVKE